jgi:CRP-like cAMP-binding protein
VRGAIARSLRRLAPIGDDAIDALAGLSQRRSFDAAAWLLRAGEQAEYCFLLETGLVRELYIDEDGQEHTRSFVEAGQVTGSLYDLLSQAPSVTFIEALEPTTTVVWRYRDFDALADKHWELHRVARRQAEWLYINKTRRERDMLALSAADRYARFRAERPALEARIQRRQLASYLGITPEHLSRLARRRTPPPKATAPRRRS